jgi:hypothetical protein
MLAQATNCKKMGRELPKARRLKELYQSALSADGRVGAEATLMGQDIKV